MTSHLFVHSLLISTLIGLLTPSVSSAHNYNYAEGGFISRDLGKNDDSGLRIAGSVDVAPTFAVFGEFSDVGPLDQITLGGLFHKNIQPRLDWTLGVSIESVDNGRNDDTGLGLRVGLRWLTPDPRFEVAPEIRHFNVFDDSNSSLRVAGLFSLTPPLQLQLAVQRGDDDRLEAGARYNF